jgi:hypothetical protein
MYESLTEDKPNSETDDEQNYAVTQGIKILKKNPQTASLAVCMTVVNM